MGALKIILTIIFVLVSIVLTVVVLMQEGKSAGLGVISGAAESYWGKNKGRSMEGNLVRITKYLAVAFLVLAAVLNLNFNRSEASNSGTDANVAATESVQTESADETEAANDTAEETEPAATEAADEAAGE